MRARLSAFVRAPKLEGEPDDGGAPGFGGGGKLMGAGDEASYAGKGAACWSSDGDVGAVRRSRSGRLRADWISEAQNERDGDEKSCDRLTVVCSVDFDSVAVVHEDIFLPQHSIFLRLPRNV